MSRRLWRKLAGCIAIEIALAAGLCAAEFDYRAGVGSAGTVTALAVQDSRGNRAVIAQAEFAITRQLADQIAPEVMQTWSMDRGVILLRGSGSAPASRQDVLHAIAAAFDALAPALLATGAENLWVRSTEGGCLAAISPRVVLQAPCGENSGRGVEIQMARAPVRGVLQVIDLTDRLRRREEPAKTFTAQAIAFGREFTVLAVGGDFPYADQPGDRMVIAPNSNDAAPFPEDPRAESALRQVLARVGR